MIDLLTSAFENYVNKLFIWTAYFIFIKEQLFPQPSLMNQDCITYDIKHTYVFDFKRCSCFWV